MKLTPVSISSIKHVNSYRPTKNYKALCEFRDSNARAVQVEDWTCSTATSCAASLNASIKHFKMDGLRAVSRSGYVYLVKEGL